MSRVLVAKYCRDGNLRNAQLGSRPSEVWRGVMAVIELFWEGIWRDESRNCFVWRFLSNGLFTVSSAYDYIKVRKDNQSENVGEQSSTSHLRRFWRSIWKCDVPNKVKLFFWRLYHDRLPDARNLSKLGIDINVNCVTCGFNMESALHIIKNCWWTRCLMEALSIYIPFIDSEYHKPADWLWDCYRFLEKEDFRKLMMCCWISWKNRNRIRFDKGRWKIEEACIIISSLLRFMKQSYWHDPRFNSRLAIMDGQSFPNKLHIRVDGSWDEVRKKAGIGIVASDALGLVCWAWAEYIDGCISASEVEGLALVKSLRIAEDLKIEDAIFETDSQEVFKVISLGTKIDNWCFSWLGAANDILANHSNWFISMIDRSSNGIADLLARRARQLSWSWKYLDAIPRCISSCLFS